MKIEVLFFASLREELGIDTVELHLNEAASRRTLLDSLMLELGEEKVAPLLSEEVSIAVNQTIEKGDFALSSGDEVAFLPPITGG